MTAIMQTTKSVNVVRHGRMVGSANLTRFTIEGFEDVPRYAVTLGAVAAEYYGAPEGELLGWIRWQNNHWVVVGCHNLEDALSKEVRESPTYLPDAPNRDEAVWMLATLRWAERNPDAPRQKLYAARWAGIRIPQEFFEHA